jgi:hypothetical protein
MDIQIVLQQLDGAKQLISSVLEQLRNNRPDATVNLK